MTKRSDVGACRKGLGRTAGKGRSDAAVRLDVAQDVLATERRQEAVELRRGVRLDLVDAVPLRHQQMHPTRLPFHAEAATGEIPGVVDAGGAFTRGLTSGDGMDDLGDLGVGEAWAESHQLGHRDGEAVANRNRPLRLVGRDAIGVLGAGACGMGEDAIGAASALGLGDLSGGVSLGFGGLLDRRGSCGERFVADDLVDGGSEHLAVVGGLRSGALGGGFGSHGDKNADERRIGSAPFLPSNPTKKQREKTGMIYTDNLSLEAGQLFGL